MEQIVRFCNVFFGALGHAYESPAATLVGLAALLALVISILALLWLGLWLCHYIAPQACAWGRQNHWKTGMVIDRRHDQIVVPDSVIGTGWGMMALPACAVERWQLIVAVDGRTGIVAVTRELYETCASGWTRANVTYAVGRFSNRLYIKEVVLL